MWEKVGTINEIFKFEKCGCGKRGAGVKNKRRVDKYKTSNINILSLIYD